MNCRKAQKHLTDILYADVRPEVREEFDRHLEECSDCRTMFESYEKILTAWDKRTPVEGPRRSPAELLLAARMAPSESTWREKLTAIPLAIRATVGASAAAVAFGLFALYTVNAQGPDTTRVHHANTGPDQKIVEEKARFFEPMLGSTHQHEDLFEEKPANRDKSASDTPEQ